MTTTKEIKEKIDDENLLMRLLSKYLLSTFNPLGNKRPYN